MTDSDPVEEMRRVAREVLRELVPEMVAEALGDPNGNAHPIVPTVPAPPVAAVLRPSTWAGPAAPGEVIGERAPARNDHQLAETALDGALDEGVEPVTIETDDDLQRFVRALIARLESPRDRRAIRAGRLRFKLQRSTASIGQSGSARGGAPAPAVRVAKGAVTERAVREAAATGARLVLARGAVLTPLARDQVRALGVEIEREGKC